MTSKRTPASLRVELRPSRWLIFYLISAHALAAGAVLLAPIAGILQILALPIIGFSLALHCVNLCQYGRRCDMLLRDEKGWWLQCGGVRQLAELKTCWVTPYAVGMRFRGRKLLLPADAFVSADSFRRLRVQLRFAPGFENGVTRFR